MARQILSGDPRLTGPLAGQGYGGPLAPDFSNAMFSEADPAAVPARAPAGLWQMLLGGGLTNVLDPPAPTSMEALQAALPEAAARYRASQWQPGVPQPGLIHDVGYGYGGPVGGAAADLLPQPPRTGLEAGMMVGMPVAPARLFHGTRETNLALSNERPLYLTPQEAEAKAYAEGAHLGGSGSGPPRVASFDVKGGKTLDINDQIFNAMDMGDDVGDAIDAAIVDARRQGFRYVEYDHPSVASEGEHKVVISLYPKDDLQRSPQQRPGT